MRIAICDDNEKDRALLRGYLEKYRGEKNCACDITEAGSGEALLAMPDAAEYDAVFMDVYLRGLDGIGTAERLQSLGFSGSYVFTTSSTGHVFQSFAFNVQDYLVKPFSYARFAQAMDKLIRAGADALLSISVTVDGTERSIPLDKIYSVETGANHDTLIHLKKTTIHSSTLISKIAELLSPYRNFLRCHRSFLVNLNKVSGTEGFSVCLENGETVMLTRRNAAELRRQINEYLWERMMED